MNVERIRQLFGTKPSIPKQATGIRLDIGCGANKQSGFVGMDMRDLPGVDIVWNWNNFPWPLPNGSVLVAMASHVVEHINPVDGNFLRWMDEHGEYSR